MKRLNVVAILILAFAGLADSAYLAQHETNGTPLLCNIQNLSGCNIVTASQYSYVFGIPVAELGILFYSMLFVLAALELLIVDRFLRRVLQGLALVGLIISLYSTFVQVFFIHALCIYCLGSAIVAVGIFIFATLIEPMKRSVPQTGPPSPSLSMPPRHN